MLTVDPCPRVVESQLTSGGLACPGCAEVVAPWGWARPRVIGRGDRRWRVRPRRGRCRACRVTHVLLPAVLLLRRCELIALIGRALALRAAGCGQRRVAAAVDVPRSTMRGWLSRFAVGAERLRAHFMRWALWLDAAAVRMVPQGSMTADAVAAVSLAAAAARRRLGVDDVWQFAAAATGGRLLCNTSSPFPAPWTV
jgi:hypothetical protein